MAEGEQDRDTIDIVELPRDVIRTILIVILNEQGYVQFVRFCDLFRTDARPIAQAIDLFGRRLYTDGRGLRHQRAIPLGLPTEEEYRQELGRQELGPRFEEYITDPYILERRRLAATNERRRNQRDEWIRRDHPDV